MADFAPHSEHFPPYSDDQLRPVSDPAQHTARFRKQVTGIPQHVTGLRKHASDRLAHALGHPTHASGLAEHVADSPTHATDFLKRASGFTKHFAQSPKHAPCPPAHESRCLKHARDSSKHVADTSKHVARSTKQAAGRPHIMRYVRKKGPSEKKKKEKGGPREGAFVVSRFSRFLPPRPSQTPLRSSRRGSACTSCS